MKKRKTREFFPIYILGLIIIFLFFGVCTKQQSLNADATSSLPSVDEADSTLRFINIFDNDTQTTLRSDAKTVSELLERAGIQLDDGDKIEPALEEEIKEDDFNINIYRARNVVVIDGLREIFVRTPSSDPEAIVKDAKVELLPADTVELASYGKFLEAGMTTAYRVIRAKTVELNFNGQKSQIRTQAKTVQDFLAEQNIDNNPEANWISLAGDTRIEDNLNLVVSFQGKHTVTIEEEIPFSEKTTMDYSLDYGTRTITQAGIPGKKNVVYDIEMHDGQEVSRNFVSEVIISAPVEQQVTVGMKVNLPAGSHEDWMSAVGISSSDFGYVNFIIERESHWNPLSRNRSSGATGLCQALPGSKMASAGSDWETNPITQLRWCNGYAIGRYGSWRGAYEFWQTHHWW